MYTDRKLVTVMFVRLGGFTAVAADLTRTDELNQLARIAAQAEGLIASHGGITTKRTGNVLLAMFGTRQARADDATRAVRAALELQKALAETPKAGLNAAPWIRVGIHTGIVLLGPGGVLEKEEPSGEDVSLARRLHDSGPAGGIVISHDTYLQTYGMFDVQDRQPLMVRGRFEPVQTYLVLRARLRSLARTLRGVEEAETEIVGRGSELEVLKVVFSSVVEKQNLRMMTILGEAGLGKSRLLREFLRWVEVVPQPASIFCGRAEADTAGLPFSLLRDVFCSRFEIQENDTRRVARDKFSRGLADLLGEPGGRDQPSGPLAGQDQSIAQLLGLDTAINAGTGGRVEDWQGTRHRAFQSVGEFFTSVSTGSGQRPEGAKAAKRAALLVLEDIHWADDDSLDLIEHLEQSCQGAPLMILCMARPSLLERRPDWSRTTATRGRLDLEPLGPEAVHQLVRSLLVKSVEAKPLFSEQVLSGAGGNPFYIEEIIKMFLEREEAESGPGGWRMGIRRLTAPSVPLTLTAVLQERLDSLTKLERAVMQAASVVGHVFWESAVGHLIGGAEERQLEAGSKEELFDALGALCRKELVLRRQTSGFGDSIEFCFKHELLRDVTYQGLAKTTRRLHHSRVAEWFIERGGERTTEFAALVAVHFEQAGLSGNAAEWYGRAGQQARTTYAQAAAVEYYQKALGLSAQSSAQQLLARHLEWQEGLSEALSNQARFREAAESYEKLRALAQALGDVAAETRAWNGLTYLHERRGDNRASIQASEQAELLARRGGEGSRGDLIRALQLRGWAYYRLGDAPKVLGLAEQTLQLCEQAGDRVRKAVSFKLYGVAYLQLGRYQEADRNFQRGLSLSQELGDRLNTAAMFSNLGESARLRGDYPAAVELYQKALEVTRHIGARPSEMIYLSNLAGARLGLGEFQQAEQDLRQAIAMTGMPKSCTLSETYGFLAKACLSQGKLGEALAAGRKAVEIGKASENHLDLAGSWRVLAQVAAALSPSGGPDRTYDPASGAEPLDPCSCFAESLREYELIGAEGEKARTLQAWAEFLQKQGRVEEGRARAEAAQEILGRLAQQSQTLGARPAVANRL